MKLTITLNDNNIKGIITELEAKGCYEVAEAIESAYNHQVETDTRKEFEQNLKSNGWGLGVYHKHSNGKISACYLNRKQKLIYAKPIYFNGTIIGSPRALSCVNEYVAHFINNGWKVVDEI